MSLSDPNSRDAGKGSPKTESSNPMPNRSSFDQDDGKERANPMLFRSLGGQNFVSQGRFSVPVH